MYLNQPLIKSPPLKLHYIKPNLKHYMIKYCFCRFSDFGVVYLQQQVDLKAMKCWKTIPVIGLLFGVILLRALLPVRIDAVRSVSSWVQGIVI